MFARGSLSAPGRSRGPFPFAVESASRPLYGRPSPPGTMAAGIRAQKALDLAGPGIGTYEDVERALPGDYRSALTPRETQVAIYAVKNYIEENLCRELNLMMVQVPLIVAAESGVNDMLDRDGSRTPIQFHIPNDRDQHPLDAQVVQAATKWKRMALKQLGLTPGEGLCTDMRAVRKDYFLDHDHSAYVDQWDWERAIRDEDRNLDLLKETVRRIWKVITGAQDHAERLFPAEGLPVPRAPQGDPLPPRGGAARTRTRTSPESSGRPRSSRSIPPSSSSASAGR